MSLKMPDRNKYMTVLAYIISLFFEGICKAQPESQANFLKTHCGRCHDHENPKGNFNIKSLHDNFQDKKTRSHWLKIIQQIESGAMPPNSSKLPPEEYSQFKSWITKEISKAISSEGRVTLRRLNRVEYENTVRDLFGIDVAVKEILPEDATSQGFDNIGEALNISPVQMERYLETAETVLSAATSPVHNLKSEKEKFDLFDSLPKWFITGVYKMEDGVVLFRNVGDSPTDVRKFRAPAPGKYKIRISASAYNSETPLPMAVLIGNFVVSGNKTRHLGYFDVPPGKPTILEIEERLSLKNDTVKIGPIGLPHVYLRQENITEYPGPGLKIHWVEIEGPYPETWPTESYRRVFGNIDPKKGTIADAEKLLAEFVPRAFRRPVSSEEIKPYVQFIQRTLDSGQNFESAMRAGYKAVMVSPNFLFLKESPGKLDDFQIASRLSYFLWSSKPDEELLHIARNGKLTNPEILHQQVERMLSSSKSAAFTENFTGQWLNLREINATTPDKTLYPEYDDLLKWSSVRETHLFFEEMLSKNLGSSNIVDSKFAILNGRLAKHYGIPGIHGVGFQKINLKPEYHRGGILTQASVLKVTANGTNTSPVIRGTWIQDKILGKPVPPPPPNVPAIEPDIRGAITIREQLAKHREVKTCASCHARIDPPGFALENYDVVGGWRDRYRIAAERKNWVNNRVGPLAKYLASYQYGFGQPVDAGDAFENGPAFSGIDEFKKVLLQDPEQIARNITGKLLAYATGQPVGILDQDCVNGILNQTKSSNYGLRSIVHAVVQSELFLSK
jgi:hypothetical protein